jgi:hypothetical protein
MVLYKAMKIIKNITLIIIFLSITSCAALSTSVSKKDLDVQTKMQKTVFLNPVDNNLKTIFIQVRNTSDKQSFNITDNLKNQLRQKGYQIINNPSLARYILQINILQAGKTSKTALEKSPFKTIDSIGFGAAGAMVGGRHGNIGGTIVGAVIGAGGSVIANSLVKDVYYSAITDVRIIEKQDYGVEPNQYQTRILSSANKVNLKWEDTKSMLEEGLANSISGVF